MPELQACLRPAAPTPQQPQSQMHATVHRMASSYMAKILKKILASCCMPNGGTKAAMVDRLTQKLCAMHPTDADAILAQLYQKVQLAEAAEATAARHAAAEDEARRRQQAQQQRAEAQQAQQRAAA